MTDAPPHPLIYGSSAEELRREWINRAAASTKIAAQIIGKRAPLDLEADLAVAHVMLSAYAFNLAGLLGWIGHEFGADAEHRAALVIGECLARGDLYDLNGDLRA